MIATKLLKISGKSIKVLLHQQKTSLALKKEVGMSGMMRSVEDWWKKQGKTETVTETCQIFSKRVPK
jgi:hypothetical protein